MVIVYLRGRAEEIRLQQAATADFMSLPETEDSTWLVCKDSDGNVVARFAPAAVAGYFVDDASASDVVGSPSGTNQRAAFS